MGLVGLVLPVGSAVETDDETNTETQVSSLEIARKSTRTDIKLPNRGAAMAWAGWAKSRGPRVSGKIFFEDNFSLTVEITTSARG